MQIEADVSREGVLTARVPDRYRGQQVRISLEDGESQSSSPWRAVSAMLDEIDAADIPRRSHWEILEAVNAFRESIRRSAALIDQLGLIPSVPRSPAWLQLRSTFRRIF
ncbi:hypothetical protein [Thiocystis minor]|uniref:hypothetical protein n=1 Tax=Thiocystis minor TaxID=61597 RepID=UPI001914A018|nr:hypothetical protein [Thiocystis minor]